MANQTTEIHDNYVKKIYDIDNPIVGAFSCMTQLDKFKNEVKIYKMLDGLGVTPKLLEVGEKYICLEKFDWTLDKAINTNGFGCEKVVDLLKIHVKPLCEVLDRMKIFHDDPSLENIVCNYEMAKFAIIDFETSDILGECDEYPNNFNEFLDF